MPSGDLVVDGIYPGGRAGNASDDPLGQLVGVSNSGGFRYLGSLEKLGLVVLTSTAESSRLGVTPEPSQRPRDIGTVPNSAVLLRRINSSANST
jgi:hypothetical protein